MDLPWARRRALSLGVDAVLVLVLVMLSLWLGGRVIGAVYVDNPKVLYVSPEADRLVAFAWTATAVQIFAAAVWRRRPLVVWLVAAGMLVVHVVTLHRLVALSPHPVRFAPLVPSDAVVLLALYGLTVAGRIRGSTAVAGLTLALALASAWAGPDGLRVLSGFLLVALTVSVFAGGVATHSRSDYLEAMTQRVADLEVVRARDAELAAAAERSRLAREIHDTVAHALGIIVVQAQGAAAAQQSRPAETGKALTAIIGVGRQALAEMRGLLRADNSSGPATEPPARLGTADVPDLAAQFRAAGRCVEVVVHGLPAVLPLQLDHATYRIVQESLTNAVKHGSPDTAVLVDIGERDDQLEIQVRSAGTSEPSDTSGNGLQGMRERVLLLGGQFEAGPDTAGWFVVRARIPLRGAT